MEKGLEILYMEFEKPEAYVIVLRI
jgi:hypothetical protein